MLALLLLGLGLVVAGWAQAPELRPAELRSGGPLVVRLPLPAGASAFQLKPLGEAAAKDLLLQRTERDSAGRTISLHYIILALDTLPSTTLHYRYQQGDAYRQDSMRLPAQPLRSNLPQTRQLEQLAYTPLARRARLPGGDFPMVWVGGLLGLMVLLGAASYVLRRQLARFGLRLRAEWALWRAGRRLKPLLERLPDNPRSVRLLNHRWQQLLAQAGQPWPAYTASELAGELSRLAHEGEQEEQPEYAQARQALQAFVEAEYQLIYQGREEAPSLAAQRQALLPALRHVYLKQRGL